MCSGIFVPDPGSGSWFFPYRIQDPDPGVKKRRITDLKPQHCRYGTFLKVSFGRYDTLYRRKLWINIYCTFSALSRRLWGFDFAWSSNAFVSMKSFLKKLLNEFNILQNSKLKTDSGRVKYRYRNQRPIYKPSINHNEHSGTQCCGTGTGTGTVGIVTFWLVEPEPEP